jgi:hypothetical protein
MIGEYIAAIHFHLTSKPFFCRLVVCPLYTCYTSIHMDMSHTSHGSALSLSLQTCYTSTHMDAHLMASLSPPWSYDTKTSKLGRQWHRSVQCKSLALLSSRHVTKVGHVARTPPPWSFELFSGISSHPDPAVFFSHNKPANNTFSHNKPAKRTGRSSPHTVVANLGLVEFQISEFKKCYSKLVAHVLSTKCKRNKKTNCIVCVKIVKRTFWA